MSEITIPQMFQHEESKNLNSTAHLLWLLTENETFANLRDSFKRIENLPNMEGITKEDFFRIVRDVLKDTDYVVDSQILPLFNEIDSNDRNVITWAAFLDYNYCALQTKRRQNFQCGNVTYHRLKQIKRDAIVKIVLLETEAFFSYAILSKYGRVCVYDGSFNYISSYMAIMSPEDQFRKEAEVRQRHRWLTDAIFMSDVQMFVVVNSTRSMTIYDASGLTHMPLWHIATFPNAIQVIKYYIKEKDKSLKTLILGDSFGDIKLLTFKRPKDDLLKKKHQDKMSVFYYQDLCNYKDYVTVTNLGRVHFDAIISMEMLQDEHETILSCSRDPRRSLAISKIFQKPALISISCTKGISCFAISRKRKQIITGSDDGCLRIYSFHSTISHPIELRKIKVSTKGLVDIAIMQYLDVFLTCDRSGVLKFLTIKDCKCVETLQLNFDSFQTVGRKIEWSPKCIYPGPKHENMQSSHIWERNCLLVTCCNTFAKIDMFYFDARERHLQESLLPSQPLQNTVLIPKEWEKHSEISTKDEEKLHSDKVNNFANEGMKAMRIKTPNLDFVPSKACIDNLRQRSEIHMQIADLENRKAKMSWAVEHCAPFLALDLYKMAEIQLPVSLPTVADKRTTALVERTRQLLQDANARTIAFSDISSSNGTPCSSIFQFQ